MQSDLARNQNDPDPAKKPALKPLSGRPVGPETQQMSRPHVCLPMTPAPRLPVSEQLQIFIVIHATSGKSGARRGFNSNPGHFLSSASLQSAIHGFGALICQKAVPEH